MASKERLTAFRQAIVDDPERVRAALEEPGFLAAFGPVSTHDPFKRNPPGWPADHPMADLFRYRDIVFGRPMADAEVERPDLPDTLADAYAGRDAGLALPRHAARLSARCASGRRSGSTARPGRTCATPCLAVERAGWDSLWVDDHLLADEGDWTDGKLEGWTTLAALATSTSRVRLGLLVAANGFRNPGLTAKLATTVDHL